MSGQTNWLRREIKFQISRSQVEPICKFMAPYCEMDHYSRLSPDGYYLINSLYLDTSRMLLLERKRANLSRRHAIRIRTYGESPKFPGFVEIKGRVDQWVHKRRAAITRPETIAFLKHGTGGVENPDLGNPTFRDACFQIFQLGLAPKIMTQYRRLAFFGLSEPYARVTFDRQLRAYKESEYNIFPDVSKLTYYDHQDQYESREQNVVLELKCEAKIPFWMKDMVRHFELRQQQFSKYDSSWTFHSDANTLSGELSRIYTS
jgi:SPX domain protein involved in polyphosphate accumulation